MVSNKQLAKKRTGRCSIPWIWNMPLSSRQQCLYLIIQIWWYISTLLKIMVCFIITTIIDCEVGTKPSFIYTPWKNLYCPSNLAIITEQSRKQLFKTISYLYIQSLLHILTLWLNVQTNPDLVTRFTINYTPIRYSVLVNSWEVRNHISDMKTIYNY